jgi:hypothetical protein
MVWMSQRVNAFAVPAWLLLIGDMHQRTFDQLDAVILGQDADLQHAVIFSHRYCAPGHPWIASKQTRHTGRHLSHTVCKIASARISGVISRRQSASRGSTASCAPNV